MKKTLLAFLVLVIGVSTISFQAEACSLNGDIDNDVDQEVYAMTSDIDIEEELKDAHQGIIDSDVSEEVLNGIVVESSDGSDVSYTVKHLGKLSRDSESDGDVYTLTAVSSTKTSSGNITEDNVYCWISLTWIDNRGTSNEIVSVSGGWNPNGRTLSDRQVWYGVSGLNGAFIDDLYEDHALDSDTYAYTPSKKLVGFQLRAYSWVSSAGYNKRINCSVTSSIFD